MCATHAPLMHCVFTTIADKEHRPPLSRPPLALLHDMAPARARRGYVFPGLTDRMNRDTLLQTIQRAASHIAVTATERPPIIIHGIRSAFLDWVTEREFAHETIMDCIADCVRSESDRAHHRSANVPQRRKIMDAWVDYVVR